VPSGAVAASGEEEHSLRGHPRGELGFCGGGRLEEGAHGAGAGAECDSHPRERADEGAGRESLTRLARSQSTMAIFLSADQIERVAKELRTAYPAATPVAVVYRASWPDEKIITGTLATIASRVKRAAITRQALILVGRAIGEGRTGAPPSRLYDETFTHGFREAGHGRRGSWRYWR